MEFQHALSKLCVGHNAAILTQRERTRKAGLNLYFAAIYTAEESSNDSRLVFGAAQKVIQDVRHNRWVDIAGQVFDVDTEVEVRKIGLLVSGLSFLLVSFNHARK